MTTTSVTPEVTTPPNAIVRVDVHGYPIPEVAPPLLAEDGTSVPADWVVHPTFAELVPLAPLDEGAYEVLGTLFHVAGADDTIPPGPPVLRSAIRHSAADREWTLVEFAPLPAKHHLELQLSPDPTFASDVQTVLELDSETAVVYRNVCGASPPDYDHSLDYSFRARTVDLAGNTSEWVGHRTADGECGCTTGPSPASLAAAGIAWFGLGRRRRRAR